MTEKVALQKILLEKTLLKKRKQQEQKDVEETGYTKDKNQYQLLQNQLQKKEKLHRPLL